MPSDDPDGPIDVDDLLFHKQLHPLAGDHITELARIERLNVRGFSEAEVRFAIIDPIVRVLGYDKGSVFSVSLERPLRFAGRNLYPDYQFALWNENFWLIEAKRPQIGVAAFAYDDLKQALLYSVHPTINAALVVLCDGLKFEIFDREVSVEAPMVRVEIATLTRDFDRVRAVLDPIQVWFFQKRRIVRHIDKVFEKEFNMRRAEEFGDAIGRRLQSKRLTILENFRSTVKSEPEKELARVSTAPLEDLTELYLMEECSAALTNAVSRRLVELSRPNDFVVMRRVFPDRPRGVNDIYMAQALVYLMRLGDEHPTVRWLPAWLAQGGMQTRADTGEATKFLLRQCLTYFEDYEPYRLVLLAGCALHRLAKLAVITNRAVRQAGTRLHALARHCLPEISWDQILSSPQRQLIGLMERETRAAAAAFVDRHGGAAGHFQSESARETLKSYWLLEEGMLASVGDYPKLMQERSVGEIRMIEWSAITYDSLAHATLCLMHDFPVWQAYVLDHHRPLVETAAALGSWAAKRMLGAPMGKAFGTISDSELAERFFLGSETTLRSLRAGYGGQQPWQSS